MRNPGEIGTARLRLVEGTAEVLHADLAGPEALGAELGCRVTEEWPPELYPPEKVQRRLAALADPAERGWWSWYAIERESNTLVGLVTFLGRPLDGEVEVGYSLCRAAWGRGLATEALQALLERAFANPTVDLVCAITTPANEASIRVLERAGFVADSRSVQPDELRLVLTKMRRSPGTGPVTVP